MDDYTDYNSKVIDKWAEGTNEKPNVIIIYADDLGYGDLSSYGGVGVKTPNVDRLLENGVKFTNGYSTSAVCTPARYSLLTGEYPFRNPRTHILPSMQTDSMKELAGAKLEGISEELLAILGISNLMDFTQITNYFGYVQQYMTLALLIFATQIAGGSLIKEETGGTIEFLYSKPVSRSAIFAQKVLANLVCFATVLLVLVLITIIGYVSFSDYNLGESIEEVCILYGGVLFVGLVYMSVGTLLSTLLKSNKGAAGVSTAIVFLTLIIGVIGVINDQLSFLSSVSPLEWIKTQKLLSEGIILKEWLIGTITLVLSMAVAHEIYKRKDLHI
jgi:ABC-2 type transport system permease protein